MPPNPDPGAALRRRRWPLFLPFALVVALGIGWSALWFYAAGRAEAEIAAWRERERGAGRQQDCATQWIGGYPFRIEVHCGGAAFELQGAPTLRLELPAALAAVQVYDPSLLIAELAGPLEVSEPGRAPTTVINWSGGRASLRGRMGGTLQRASVALDALSVLDSRLARDQPLFRAQRLELHGREAERSSGASPAVETVLRLNGATAETLHPLAAKPIDADVAAVVRGLDDISPKPWPARFRAWQARDGELEIVRARIQQEDVIAVGAGTLRLTSRGGLDGSLQVTVVGVDKLLKMLDLDRMMSEGQVGATLSALDRLIPGLGGIARQNAGPGLVAALGQRTVLEDKPAVAFPVRFADGTVFLGPFQVGEVPPLF